jgi:transposase-like protein
MGKRTASCRTESTKIVAVRLARVDADIIQAVARQHDITQSDVIRWAIAEWEERHIESIRRSTSG